MSRELETLGFKELESDLLRMAAKLGAAHGGEWKGIAESILNEAAEPIKEAMKRYASPPNIKTHTGKLLGAIDKGRVTKRKHKEGGYTIKVGVENSKGVGYARPVEFGHGGPAPARAHKFARPAYEEQGDRAYEIIRRRLKEEIDKIRS